MKLIWRRGRKSEILLLSNSVTFAWWPVGERDDVWTVTQHASDYFYLALLEKAVDDGHDPVTR